MPKKSKDYYSDGGFFVFKREYLLRRGYCCKNGCKHCPYKEKRKRKNREEKS